MKSNLTPKQKKFAENIAIKKMTQSDALRDAYNTENYKEKSIHEKASFLASKVKVASRVELLTKKLEEKLFYTAKQSFDKFTEIQNLALTPDGENGRLDLSNAKDCEKEKAKLANLYSENNKSGASKTLNIIAKVDESEIEDKIRKLIDVKE